MAEDKQWRAFATYPRPETTDVERLDALTKRLGGFAIVTDDGEVTVRAEWDVTGPTMRAAAEAALRDVRATWGHVFGTAAYPDAFRILTADAHDRELAAPPAADLVGWKEIAEMLGVSTQRAQQLAALPAFPAPVAHLAAGPVFTRASIEVFERGWERRPGRPRKTE